MTEKSWISVGALFIAFCMAVHAPFIATIALISVALIQIFPTLLLMQKERNRAIEEQSKNDLKILGQKLE